jgi:hypothetical protein
METFGVTFTSKCTVTLEVRASNRADAIRRAEMEVRRMLEEMGIQHEPGHRVEFSEITRYEVPKSDTLPARQTSRRMS